MNTTTRRFNSGSNTVGHKRIDSEIHVSPSIAHEAARAATTPPSAATTSPSTRNWRISRIHDAPIAARTAISRWRLIFRARNKFATLADAIKRTNPTAPSRTSSIERIAWSTRSRSSFIRSIAHPSLLGRSFASCVVAALMRRWASSSDTPGFSLASGLIKEVSGFPGVRAAGSGSHSRTFGVGNLKLAGSTPMIV